MINVHFERQILEQTYFDKVTVKRFQKVVDEDTGITENKLAAVYEDIKCAVSAKESTREVPNGEVASIVILNKLFINPSYIIDVGDTLEISFFDGRKDVYLASKGFYYTSHAEIPIVLKERA